MQLLISYPEDSARHVRRWIWSQVSSGEPNRQRVLPLTAFREFANINHNLYMATCRLLRSRLRLNSYFIHKGVPNS